MDFVAIDFETARNQQTPCSLGLTIVENGKVIHSEHYMINPQSKFSSYAVQVHGISAQDVASAPTFPEIWIELEPIFRHYPIVAHNAVFDIAVLEKTCRRYHIPLDSITSFCTMCLCRENYPAWKHYGLDDICSRLGIPLDHHHSADNDSRACAEIMLYLLRDRHTHIHALEHTTPVREQVQDFSFSYDDDYSQSKENTTDVFNTSKSDESLVLPSLTYVEDYDLNGKNVAITGDVPGFSRADIELLISELGGINKSSMSRRVNYLIVGYENTEIVSDQRTYKSQKILYAEELIQKGYNIQFISGVNFMKREKDLK